jgi:hypothetical protein
MLKDLHRGLGGVVIESVAKAGAHEKDAFISGALELGGHDGVESGKTWSDGARG